MSEPLTIKDIKNKPVPKRYCDKKKIEIDLAKHSLKNKNNGKEET